MQPLATERLLLEPLRVEHAAEMHDVLSDPRLYRFTGGEPPSAHLLEERYRRQVAGPGRDDVVWHNWVLRRLEDGVAVGYVQATLTADGARWTGEIAWVVGTRFQNAGFATEGTAAVLQHLGAGGVAAFRAHIADDNVASARVATRLGFARTETVDDEGERIYLRDGLLH